MTEQTDAAEGLAENERDRIWYALATTRCGPLHADDGWTPGEPCESCGDLANEVTPYLSRIVERLIAAREAAAEARGAERALREAAEVYRGLDDALPICAGHVTAELDARAAAAGGAR